MKIHLQREIDDLKKELFHVSSLVEENFKRAIRAVATGDADLAAQVKPLDREIDRLEVEVEENCLKVLALHQPVAVDLRFLIAVLKMNNDLERIGDLAVNIAGVQKRLAGRDAPAILEQPFGDLAEKARAMLRLSLEALMELDAVAARNVLKADDEVDDAYLQFVDLLNDLLQDAETPGEYVFAWMMAAKSIERVADLATNIAEDTIYTVEGEIVRHGGG